MTSKMHLPDNTIHDGRFEMKQRKIKKIDFKIMNQMKSPAFIKIIKKHSQC